MSATTVLAGRRVMLLWLVLPMLSMSSSAQVVGVSAADYMPTDPSQYCTKTRTFTYGRTGSDTSRIVGSISVPYKSGTMTGIVVEGGYGPGDGFVAFANDGSSLTPIVAAKDADGSWMYISRDCQLSGPIPGFTFSAVTDGMISTTGLAFGVKGPSCLPLGEWDSLKNYLIKIQRVVAGGIRYDNALIVWELTSRPYTGFDFKGKEGVVGVLPTSTETGNYSADGFIVFAKGLGPVAGGDISSPTGVLSWVWELTAMDCTTPSVRDGSVINAASLLPGIASGGWITVKGTSLAAATRGWQASDFSGNRLPTQLDGVSVDINGKPAFLCYISPTQINALAPDDPTSGPVQVVVATPNGRSAPVLAEKRPVAPGWFMFEAERRKYIAAVHPDGAYLGKPGLYTTLNLRPAKPGDIVVLYGTGFGLTNPLTPAEQLVAQPATLASPVTIRVGGVVAEVAWVGLVASGLNQFNVKVPDVPDGDQAVVAEVGGFRTQEGAFITVQR